MQTHYAGHDKEYRRRRAAGYEGWEKAEGVQEIIADLERMMASPGFPKSGTLLEVGCGAGDQSLWLVAQGYAVTGVDIAPSAIEWAREKAQERGLTADFRVGDVCELPDFPDAGFDVALDGRCFHCIIGDDRAKFLAATRRVLKPGGVFHVATMCGDPVAESAKTNYDSMTRCTIYGDIATRYFGRPEDILAEIEAAGFQITGRQVQHSQNPDDQHMLFVTAEHLCPL